MRDQSEYIYFPQISIQNTFSIKSAVFFFFFVLLRQFVFLCTLCLMFGESQHILHIIPILYSIHTHSIHTWQLTIWTKSHTTEKRKKNADENHIYIYIWSFSEAKRERRGEEEKLVDTKKRMANIRTVPIPIAYSTNIWLLFGIYTHWWIQLLTAVAAVVAAAAATTSAINNNNFVFIFSNDFVDFPFYSHIFRYVTFKLRLKRQ